jgi:CRISPR-associated protein Cas8c/Csd1 subtype I-C
VGGEGVDAPRLISRPTPEEVRDLIDSYRTVKRITGIDAGEYHAMGLTAAKGRLVVRDYITQTVADVERSLGRWFLAQRITSRFAEEKEKPHGLDALVMALCRDRDEIKSKAMAQVTQHLTRTALTGVPAPDHLLGLILARVKHTGKMTHAQAALLKLVLALRVGAREEVIEMAGLDTNCDDPAYLMGRLLSTLEWTQAMAIENINATIIDKHLGQIMVCPAYLLGRMTADAQRHLGKLKSKPGLHVHLQKRIEEILGMLPPDRVPARLDIADQGMLLLGYYHQRAWRTGSGDGTSPEIAETDVPGEDDNGEE